jgi:hypothetical protein
MNGGASLESCAANILSLSSFDWAIDHFLKSGGSQISCHFEVCAVDQETIFLSLLFLWRARNLAKLSLTQCLFHVKVSDYKVLK